METVAMTDKQYKSIRRRDKRELERMLECSDIEEIKNLIRQMLEDIQSDIED